MKRKINLKALFIVAFPAALILIIHFSFNYLPLKEYLLYPVGILIGATGIIWWQWTKLFLFATDIKIEHEGEPAIRRIK